VALNQRLARYRASPCAACPGGRELAGSNGKAAKVWDAATGRELLTLRCHGGDVLSVAWGPDGRRLATGSGDQTTKVWDVGKSGSEGRAGQELLTLRGHTRGISSVAWSLDGKRLATRGGDKTAKVWDAATGKELGTLGGRAAKVTAWPGARTASGSQRGAATGLLRCGTLAAARNC